MTMIHLLADIQAKMAEGKSTGDERGPKKYNRKETARTVCLLKKEISNYEEDRLSSRFAALYDTIKQMKKNG